MSRKNTIVGVVLVAACVLCVWYVSLAGEEAFSAKGTLSVLGEGVVISGDDGVVYIPMTGIPGEVSVGSHVSFTAVLNVSAGMYRGAYKPVDVLDISAI